MEKEKFSLLKKAFECLKTYCESHEFCDTCELYNPCEKCEVEEIGLKAEQYLEVLENSFCD